MKRNALRAMHVAATAAAIASQAGTFGGRHFLLEEASAAIGRVRFLSQAVELAEGQKQSWVTLTRVGDFSDPRYGRFSITLDMLNQMVGNFDKRVLGQDIFIDVSHRPSDGAAAKILKLAIETGRLRALVEWTAFGIDAVRNRGFTYLSAEFHEKFTDNEKQLQHGCVLLGAGLTIRPVIKQLDPIQLSVDDGDHVDAARICISPALLRELTQLSQESDMDHLKQLEEKLKALGLSDAVVTKLLAEAKKQIDAAADVKAKDAIVLAWEETGKTVHAEVKKLAAAGGGGNVTITLATPDANVEDAVTKALAARDKAADDAKTSLQAKHKLLADTIKAGDSTLTDEGVTALATPMHALITAVSTDDQVKALAAMVVDNAKKLSAAVKLATLGYAPPSGSVHISVDSSNEVKSLQETVDKRLGYTRTEGDEKRFYATGGRLLAANKEYADRVLAEYDRAHGAHLHIEHKALAAGTGIISDIKVPYSVERTVLREALYNLISLNFMNVGTAAMAPQVMIPYSWRDTTAAGTVNTRIYERQAIQKAGIKQDWDIAYPIPQKLAFNVSNEMQYLLAASPINFDPIAENVANMVRIVGEDTEAINLNEIVRASDEYAVVAVSNEAVASGDGTKTIFALNNFPVAKPRKYFDLQGAQVGSTVNAISVSINSVATAGEYLPNPDGTALANGTYWVMDYNLGEVRFVNQAGVAVVPPNTHAIVASYSYSTNVSKFDIDLGSLTVGAKYDNLLTAIGTRRSVIEDDRYYTANMVLMTGGVDNALGQATTFTANGARTGTSLNADGTVGVTKGVGTFKVRGPGLLINDNRIVVAERGNSHFRMLKPWSMGPLQDARNSNGNFIAAKEGYGEQFIASHTPVNRKLAATSVVLYSGNGRVDR
ncbi:phage protease [Ramlibacter sp.]|uniref:phage protease n=1 Tax=Ramlibacter sp. TaxID=1917967 RepID=UPI003D0FD6FC